MLALYLRDVGVFGCKRGVQRRERVLFHAKRWLSTKDVEEAKKAQDKDVGKVEGKVVVDIRGDEWVLKKNPEGEWFYYNKETWETRNDEPPTSMSETRDTRPEGVQKPQYATDWYDSRYPEWVQYIEFNSKRRYYFNTSTQEVSWAPPDNPDLDIFRQEILEMTRPLKSVPEDSKRGILWKRMAAAGIDFAASFTAGCVFGGLVYVDLEDPLTAQMCIGISTWALFIARDMIIERGTRSPGKKLMKLEVVRMDGQLPSRWNNFFRNVYAPLYTTAVGMLPFAFGLSAVELGLMLFTPKGQRLGDLMGRTWVIEELPDREERVAEKTKRDEEDDARE